jgi:hypothetical protein
VQIVWMVVAVMSFAWVTPAAVAQDSSPPTSWGAFAERLGEWAGDLWRTVAAGSEGQVVPEEPTAPGAGGIVLEGPGETSTSDSPESGGEQFPGMDPDG